MRSVAAPREVEVVATLATGVEVGLAVVGESGLLLLAALLETLVPALPSSIVAVVVPPLRIGVVDVGVLGLVGTSLLPLELARSLFIGLLERSTVARLR